MAGASGEVNLESELVEMMFSAGLSGLLDLAVVSDGGESKQLGKRVALYPPQFTRTRHQMAKKQIDQRHKKFSDYVETNTPPWQLTNTLNHNISASKTAFGKLKLTTIANLTLEKSAKGKYLLARVIEDWFSIAAWNTVIEDHRGHVIGLTLYNYPLEEIFSLGDVIIIKEPYLRLPNDNFPILRCDCPTDIIVLRPASPLFGLVKKIKWKNVAAVNDPLTAVPVPTTASQWKERGNGFFDRNQLILAREAYQLALSAVDSEGDPIEKILHLNLLAVQLRLEYFEWVVENGEKLLITFPDEKKAIFRLGKAYYGLRNYGKAFNTYRKFCLKFPKEKEGPIEFMRAKERVRETKGEFDFAKLRKTSVENPLGEMDCADYCGPVKIAMIPGKGRGLVLTKDVEKGAIIMVSKALAAALGPFRTKVVQIEPGKKLNLGPDQTQIVTKISRLVIKNPQTFGPQIYDLYSGGAPAQLFCDEENKNELICDVQLIKSISRFNSFSFSEIYEGISARESGSGLFLLPSYMNHSCVPNAHAYEFYNDVMVVRALKNMKEGTEVTVTYVPLELNFKQRAQLLSDRGFTCRCTKCKSRI